MCSLWRNDADRRLEQRALHLLEKVQHWDRLRFIWVVGDSEDATEDELRRIASEHSHIDITVTRHDTGIVVEDMDSRLLRLSQTGNAFLELVTPDDVYVLDHESDIVSPPDLVPRMLATGKCPLAGWPILVLPDRELFYDIWAYRSNGVMFGNLPPYRECYKPDEIFEVDSAGTVLLFHAEDVLDGVRFVNRGVLDICHGLKERNRRIWVDPTLRVEQPGDLWQLLIPRE